MLHRSSRRAMAAFGSGNQESLDVLRGNKMTSIRTSDGLPGHRVTSLFEDHDGRLWVGIDRTLTIYEHGRFRSIPATDGRPLGIVTAITEDTDRNIWAASDAAPEPGVFRIAHDRVVEEFKASQIPFGRSVAADPHGGVWFGFRNGSLARYRAGKFEIVVKDLSPRDTVSLAAEADGSVWGTTRNGVFRWSDGVLKRLGLTNGLPCDQVASVIKDDDGVLWLYSKCGVVSIAAAEIERWWQHPESRIRVRTLDALDGAQVAISTFLPQASKSYPDGRATLVRQRYDPPVSRSASFE